MGGIHAGPEVAVHLLAVVLQSHGFHGAHGDGAGVIYQNVYLAETLKDLLHHCLHLPLIFQVARECRHIGTLLSDIAPCLFEILLIPRADGYPSALGGRLTRQHQAEPAGTACNEHNLSTKIEQAAPDHGRSCRYESACSSSQNQSCCYIGSFRHFAPPVVWPFARETG
jgi:hypothetical protein